MSIAEAHLRSNDIIDMTGYKWYGNNRTDIHINAWTGSGV
jgi:hypothetical protein